MLSGCSGRRNGKIHRPKLLFLGKIAKIGGLNCYFGCPEGKRAVWKAKELSGRQKSGNWPWNCHSAPLARYPHWTPVTIREDSPCWFSRNTSAQGECRKESARNCPEQRKKTRPPCGNSAAGKAGPHCDWNSRTESVQNSSHRPADSVHPNPPEGQA